MLRDPMGSLRAWADGPPVFEERIKERDYTGSWFGLRSLPNFSSAIENQGSGDFSGLSQSSYDGSSSSSGGNVPSSAEDHASLLMDGSVRAMLKKVTVNEGALNQTIQSLGGGEKGLKELMSYIMLWVREHKDESSEKFSLSQNLENLTKPFGYGVVTNPGDGSRDLHQFYQPFTKSRRLGEGGVDASDASYRVGATFVDVGGSRILPGELQCNPKLETSCTTLGPVTLPGLHDAQQLVASSLGSGLQCSFASGHDNLSRSLAATTRAARRNRIARQRQSVQLQSAPRNGTATCARLWSVAPPTLDLRNSGMMFHHPAPAQMAPVAVRKADHSTLTFLLQKELRPSDVGNLGRIILPKKEAEMHLPILALREGVLLQMEDFDSGYCWNIRYRFWPNNKSRMYLLENTGEFVKSRHLQEGDLLILYRNQQGNYVLRGKKKVHFGSSSSSRGGAQKHAHSLARAFPEATKPEEVLKERDFAVGLEAQKVKAEPTVLVGDDDPFFKEDVMHNIGSTFGPGLMQPLERFPSLHLDFPLDEIMAGIPKDDDDDSTVTEPNSVGSKVVPKPEPAE